MLCPSQPVLLHPVLGGGLLILFFSSILSIASLGKCETVFNHESVTHTIKSNSGDRVRGFSFHENSTFVLGAFFAVHEASSSGDCSSTLDLRGLERIEAFLYAIDRINSDPELLPNITLGYEVRDTCTLENIALDEAVSVLYGEAGLNSGGMCEELQHNVVAMIGPTTSQVAIPLAGLLRLYRIPQVSYSASSPSLNNRDRYGYFFRTIPPDDLQAQAMIDLLVELDWSLVTILHSNNEYGETGSERFRQIADSVGVCIDLDLGIDEDFYEQDFFELALKLYNNSYADVVVFFASHTFISPFMEQLDNVTADAAKKREFVWIASESWSQASNIVNEFPDIAAKRLIGLAPISANSSLDEFHSYFANLTLSSNKRNPFFMDYFKHYHECTGENCQDMKIYDTTFSYTPFNVQLVVESVYSIAHAIDNYLNDSCDSLWDAKKNPCSEEQLQELNGSVILRYLQNLNFTSPFGKQVYFDAYGNPKGSYEVTSYELNSDMFVRIGSWDESLPWDNRLQLFTNLANFGFNQDDGLITGVNSSCRVCPPGHVKISAPSSCCVGECRPCVGPDYTSLLNASTCSSCPENTWGNSPLSGSDSCQSINEKFLTLDDGFGIFLTVFGGIGVVCVAITAAMMGILWNNPVIKSSGREQMTLLLFGVIMCFMQTIVFLLRPSYAVCFFQRAGTWFCFSIILSALLIKLVRITRIFLRKKTSKPPRFIQPYHQILFSLLLVATQMLLVLISLIVVYPGSETSLLLNEEHSDDHPTLLLQCTRPNGVMFAILLLFCSAQLVISNVLALVTIKFPDNFNEVRYVAFTTFSVGLVWMAFCVSYFATKPQYHTALFSFGIQMSGISVLFCFFLPRIFSAIVMQYFTKKELYSFSTSSSNHSNRLSTQIATEKLTLPVKIAGESYEEEMSTDTFKRTRN